MTIPRLMEILEGTPGAYEDFALCTAYMIDDLSLVSDFLEFHEENPDAKTDEILSFLIEVADLRPLPIAK